MRKIFLALWIGLLPVTLHAAGPWRTFTDIKGRKIEGRVLDLGSDFVLVEIKRNGHQVTIPFDQFEEEELDTITSYQDVPSKPGESATTPSADEAPPEGDPKRGKLYPLTRDEIRSGIREIMKRPAGEGIGKDLQTATNTLNVYRFLCGVPSDVKADAGFSKSATDAAMACQKNGGLSHSIGHSTECCNLSSMGNFVASVSQYIEDGGANNRERRGHREWCLNPPMGKVGFGSAGGSYSAMWCMDKSGKSAKGIWTYPRRGLFPLEYMHGNAWSLYGVNRPGSPSDLKIEIHKLSRRPDRPFNSTEEIPGREIPVNPVSCGMSAINFEPATPAKRGIYWVRVKGRGVSEGWLVELY
jgi:hypothetical protein